MELRVTIKRFLENKIMEIGSNSHGGSIRISSCDVSRTDVTQRVGASVTKPDRRDSKWNLPQLSVAWVQFECEWERTLSLQELSFHISPVLCFLITAFMDSFLKWATHTWCQRFRASSFVRSEKSRKTSSDLFLMHILESNDYWQHTFIICSMQKLASFWWLNS